MQIKFWKDKSKKLVDPELFSTQAEQLAKVVYNSKDSKKNNLTQLRRFYDEVLLFDSRLKELPEDKQKSEFEKYLPYLKMLNAKAAYSMARDLISNDFKQFITDSLKQINDKDDFNVFKNFFEAFMGFYRFFYEEKAQAEQGGRK